MIQKIYDAIMNENNNAFAALPKTTKFQLMTILSYMWCGIFSIGIGSFMFFGVSLVLHLLVLIGVLFTAYLFDNSRKQFTDHRLHYRDEDGGAKYDDIWGA